MSVNTEKVQDSIFGAINTIVNKRMSEISFDETIICTIINDSDKKNGKYYVTDGSIKFLAYADSDKYRNNEQVRVSIPKGDYTKEKFIVGKYTNENENSPITYISPLESVIELEDISISKGSIAQWGINICDCGKETSNLIWSQNISDKNIDSSNGIYTTFTLQAEFKTALSAYDLMSGKYGLRLYVTVKPNADSATGIRWECDLNSEDMFGNPYSFVTYTKHAKRFEFHTFGHLQCLELYLFQDGNFKRRDNKIIHQDKCENNIDGTNILVRNIKVGFGSDITQVSDNTLKIMPIGNLNYYGNSDVSEKKEIALLWYNKDKDNKYIGFSDGIYDENYDEIKYLEDSRADSRLISRQGQTNIPEDEKSLTLLANLEEATPKIEKISSLITKDINTLLNEFKSLIASDSELQDKFKDINTDVKILDNLDLLKSEYKKVFEFVYNKYVLKNDPENLNKEELGDYGTEIQITINNFIKNLSDFLFNLYIKINDENEAYRGYQNIYDIYSYKLNKIKFNIEELLALEVVNKVFNEDFIVLQSLLDSNFKYIKYTSIINKQDYENKYSLYLCKYKLGEIDNSGINLPAGWIKENKLNILPSKMENSKYHQSKSDQIFSIGMIKGEDNDTKSAISAELSPYQKQEKFMVVMFYNHEMFMSNELTYENLAPIIDIATLDQGKGLTIEHKKDSYPSYHIYTLTNNLRDIADLSRQREIQCHFEGATMSDEALENAEVYWYIPTNSTMLWYNEEYLKNKGFIIPENKEKEGYVCFYRQIKRKYKDKNWTFEDGNGNDTRSFWYQIKEHYDPNVSQFEIICEAYRATELPIYKIDVNDNAVVEAYQKTDAVADTPLISASLFAFGISETSGTKYTLAIERATNNLTTTESSQLELNVKLFDYNNQQMDILFDGDVNASGKGTNFSTSWEWLMQGDNTNALTPIINETGVTGLSIEAGHCGILKSSVATGIKTNNNVRQVDLSVFYSVPWSTGNCYMSGPTTIIYDSLGKLDRYQDNSYYLYDKETHEKIEVDIDLIYLNKNGDEYNGDQDSLPLDYRYLPKLNNNSGLTPSNMYLTGLQYMPLVTLKSKDGKYIWKQPIIIIQNQYSSSMLNEWDGSFEIDEENGTIMSSMLGAGRKTTNNTFEGILMGELTKADLTYPMGLYGLHDGVPSFGFKVDGTAFLGKNGRGQLLFDGNESILKSAGYEADSQGMIIDFDDAFIDMRDIYLDDSGEYKTNNKSHIRIDVKSPYFEIDAVDKPLIYIADNSYYLQSANYELNENGSVKSGTHYDLVNGTIDSTYFHVTSEGKVSATSGDVGGWQIENWGIYKTVEKTKEDGTKYNLTTGLQIPTNGNISLTIGATNFNDWTSASFYVTHAGQLNANGAIIQGKITADEGEIAGWLIQSNRIEKGSWNPSEWSSNNSYLSFFASTPQGAYSSDWGTKNWLLYLYGGKCGVDDIGRLYAAGAVISGNITATSLTITKDAKITGLIVTNDMIVQGSINGAKIEEGTITAKQIQTDALIAQSVSVDSEYGPAIEIKPDSTYVLFGSGGSDNPYGAGAKIPVSPYENFSLGSSKIRIYSSGNYGYIQTLADDSGNWGGAGSTYNMMAITHGSGTLNGKWYYNDYSDNTEIATKGWVNSKTEIACLAVEDTTFTWSNGSAIRTHISSQNKYGMVIGADGISGDLVGTWWCNGNNLSSSDLRVKNSINTISSNYQQFYDNLNPVSYKYNDGNSGRTHTGFIAQEIVSALEKANLTTQDFAAVCQRDHNIEGSEWGVRYGEFVALNTWQIQLVNKKLKEQENQINELKQELNNLKFNFNIDN